jgi:hypothetical protein
MLHSEVAIGERAAQVSCPTYDQYIEEIAVIRQLSPKTRHAPMIQGAFPSRPDIKAKERTVHKKLTAAEEALARKHELTNAISERWKGFNKGGGAVVGREQTEASEEVAANHLTNTPLGQKTKPKPKSVQVSPEVLKVLHDLCNTSHTHRHHAHRSTDLTPEQEQRRHPRAMSKDESSLPSSTLSSLTVNVDSLDMNRHGATSSSFTPKSHALRKLMGLVTSPPKLKRPSMLETPLLEDLAKPGVMADIQQRRRSSISPVRIKPDDAIMDKQLHVSEERKLAEPREGSKEGGEAWLRSHQKLPTMSFLEELKAKSSHGKKVLLADQPNMPFFIDEDDKEKENRASQHKRRSKDMPKGETSKSEIPKTMNQEKAGDNGSDGHARREKIEPIMSFLDELKLKLKCR